MRPLSLIVFVLCAWLTNPNLQSQESGADQLAKLIFIHSVEIEEAEKPYRAKLDELNGNYIKALEREAEKAQKAGQLDSLLAIRTEIKHVEENGAPGSAPFPRHLEMRTQYSEAAAIFAQKNIAALSSPIKRHIGELAELKTELTKAGELETAVAISRRIESMSGSASAGTPVSPTNSASGRTLQLATNEIADSPIFSEVITAEEVDLEKGVYKLPGRVMIGDDDREPREDRFGHVSVPPGSTLQEGEIFINNGSVTAETSLFSGVDLNVDLHGELNAEECIFDGGKLRKGGAWSVKYYSAKFTLENCLLNKCFPEPMKPRANGVKITECTVIEATISPAEYYETPVEESESEWRMVERCLFINCEIPESFLLMTSDCVFENCEFVKDIDDVAPEKSASIRMYFRNSEVAPPAGNNQITFKGEDAIDMKKNFGSDLSFDFK